MQQYLQACAIIDWRDDAIVSTAQRLAAGSADRETTARRCFEFVRDEIPHSWDLQRNPVTCRASDVLRHKTGFCYAKSHLLAALLRANTIPAGLCYQRLLLDSEQHRYCLHGLNAVHLPEHGWVRIDARGNSGSISAQFVPPQEKLAFPVRGAGEADLPNIYTEPLPVVVEALQRAGDIYQLAGQLPDLQPATCG
ncbi:transglutaminase family protein [Microbulbifer sp. SAOS-129_SWC]|uniref:transglutaminase-like domain-containing protein n=1 Tax=Microbulbifer sp. SAOS-129_SWC TaxID=3145235 RepID=UPI003217B445